MDQARRALCSPTSATFGVTRPLRILVVAKGLGRGGTERLLTSGLAHLDATRFQAEVAYVLPWKDALVAEVRARDVPVHCLGAGRAGRLAWPWRLLRLVAHGHFDIVHTHMPAPAVVARIACMLGGPAVVHTEHNVWERYRPATRWANAATYHRNAAVLAVSKGVAESIRLRRRRPRAAPAVEVLIHGIDDATVRRGAAARANGRRLLGLDDGGLVIGTVGNFTAKKDQRALLDATELLVHRYPGIRLVIVGSGPLEDSLRGHADRLGLGGTVVWTGSRDDVPDLLPALDVFVLSSRHEGLSIALIEALAAGVPCVATDVGGIPEVVEDEVQGILVPPGQPRALAAAIDRLLADPALRQRLGEQAILRAGRFQLSTAVNRLQEVYESVLVGR
jgi:glycosyltransferase involved in cell wall biosynthesis